MTVNEAIGLLNGTTPNQLPAVMRVMLMSQIQVAAKQGNRAAAEFVELCALNVATATKH